MLRFAVQIKNGKLLAKQGIVRKKQLLNKYYKKVNSFMTFL